jgi:beta-lactam-binding protein with PASTA domain
LLAAAALCVAVVALVLAVLAFQHDGPRTPAEHSVEVPTVVGMTRVDAAARLADAGFIVQETPVRTVQAPAGTVLTQTPPPGSKATSGQKVTLTIAAGP